MKRLMSDEMEERLPGLFEPHSILPVQYFTRLQRSAAWSGEQRLMAAILEDAVAVSTKRNAPKTSKARQVLRETLRWLRSNDRTWTFSFLRICDHLDLDPGAIRCQIRILRGEELAQPLVVSRVVNQASPMDPMDEADLPRRAAAG
jgi:hypothetical protein